MIDTLLQLLITLVHIFQTDLKGLPIFIMNHVLKRHPLALHYVRRQLTYPHAVSYTHSPSHGSSDDIDELEGIVGPAVSKHEHKVKAASKTFEEGVPTWHFIDDHS